MHLLLIRVDSQTSQWIVGIVWCFEMYECYRMYSNRMLGVCSSWHSKCLVEVVWFLVSVFVKYTQFNGFMDDNWIDEINIRIANRFSRISVQSFLLSSSHDSKSSSSLQVTTLNVNCPRHLILDSDYVLQHQHETTWTKQIIDLVVTKLLSKADTHIYK